MVGIIVDGQLSGRYDECFIVPMTINYDKVLEDRSHAREMLGGKKIKESFGALVRAAPMVLSNCGRVEVGFSEPISVAEYVRTHMPSTTAATAAGEAPATQAQRAVVQRLGYDVEYALLENYALMPMHVVAAALLSTRKPLKPTELLLHARQIGAYVRASGGQLGSQCRNGIDERLLLHTLPKFGDLAKLSADGCIVPFDRVPDYAHRSMLLAYYANALLHLFARDGAICCAQFAAAADGQPEEGVPSRPVADFGQALARVVKILQHELVVLPAASLSADPAVTAAALPALQDAEYCHFLRAMFWPIVDAYTLTAIAIADTARAQERSRAELVALAQATADSLQERSRLYCYSSCSTVLISNAINYFIDEGVLALGPKASPHLGLFHLGFHQAHPCARLWPCMLRLAQLCHSTEHDGISLQGLLRISADFAAQAALQSLVSELSELHLRLPPNEFELLRVAPATSLAATRARL